MVGCWNDATYTLRDAWGITLNLSSGDYKLPDGTKGNILTNPGPLINFDPESEAYNDDDTDGYVSSGGGSSAATARGTAVLTAADTRGTGTASSSTGGGVVSGSLDDENTASGTAIMGMWQGGWPLVSIVAGIALIKWM